MPTHLQGWIPLLLSDASVCVCDLGNCPFRLHSNKGDHLLQRLKTEFKASTCRVTDGAVICDVRWSLLLFV